MLAANVEGRRKGISVTSGVSERRRERSAGDRQLGTAAGRARLGKEGTEAGEGAASR